MLGGRVVKMLSEYKNKLFNYAKANSKEFVMASVAQVIYLTQSLVQNKIFTSFFSTAVYGKWAILVSVYSLISMIPFSSIDQGIYKVAYTNREKGNEKELYSLIAISYFLGFCIYTIIFVAMNIVQENGFFANGYLAYFCLYAFTEIIKNSFVVIDNAYRNRKRVLVLRIFGFTSRTILFIITYLLGRFTIKNVLLILFVTNMCIFIYQKDYFRKITIRVNQKVMVDLKSEIVRFSKPLMIWAIFGWMQNMIGRWYLNRFVDLESVAMYSILVAVSYFVPSAIYAVLNAYVMPVVFSKDRAVTPKLLLMYMGTVGVTFVAYWWFVYFAGSWMILLLTSPDYLRITKYLPITTASASIYVLAQLSTIEIFRKGKTNLLLIPNIIPGLSMSTIGFFLIKCFRMEGAVVNYVMGQILYSIMVFYVVVRDMKMRE